MHLTLNDINKAMKYQKDCYSFTTNQPDKLTKEKIRELKRIYKTAVDNGDPIILTESR